MIGSSVWKLPLLLVLLLPLSISFHLPSSAIQCRGMKEFSSSLKELEDSVANCPKNCSSIHITETRCKCLNLTMSQGEYTLPEYFKAGLKSLLPSSSKQETIKQLIDLLERMVQRCEREFKVCSKNVKYELVISPNSLHMKMKHTIQQMSSIPRNATQ